MNSVVFVMRRSKPVATVVEIFPSIRGEFGKIKCINFMENVVEEEHTLSELKTTNYLRIKSSTWVGNKIEDCKDDARQSKVNAEEIKITKKQIRMWMAVKRKLMQKSDGGQTVKDVEDADEREQERMQTDADAVTIVDGALNRNGAGAG